MNTFITKLITDIKQQVEVVNYKTIKKFVDDYYTNTIWSNEKEEWNKMNKNEQRNFIMKLLGTIQNTQINPSKIVKTTRQIESNTIPPQSEKCEETLSTIIETLQNQKARLIHELNEVNKQIQELLPNKSTKMSQMRDIYNKVGGIRKDFIKMVVEAGLCGKPYASTAYQLLKKK